jgi:hypothetical protein
MAWFERMPKPLQAWLAIGGIVCGLIGGAFAMGAATSGTVSGLRDLPARTVVLESQVDTLQSVTDYLMHVDSLRPSVWGSVSQMAADVRETRCYVRAMARKLDPLSECSALLNERNP